MIKRVFMVVLAIIILTGVCGCMKETDEGLEKKETKKYTMEEKKEMVLEYLKDKYDEEFEGIAYTPKDWSSGGDSFFVCPKSGTRKDGFEVWGIVNKENGEYEFTDGYFGVYIRDEYEKVMRGFIDEIYSEYKIYIKTKSYGGLTQRLNRNTKISEIYMKGEKGFFDADTYIYVKQSSAEGIDIKDAAQRIASKMAENKLVGCIDIIVILDEKYDAIKLDGANRKKASSKENLVESLRLNVNTDLEIKNYAEGM